MKKNLIVCFLALFFGCTPRPLDYTDLANLLVGKYAIQMEKEGILMTSYGGEFMYDVAKINVGFRVYQPMTIDQARVLFVQKVREFLALVNSDEAIRPYLHDYPFTVENLFFSLSFFDEKGKRYTGDYVSFVTTVGTGKICYSHFSTISPKYDIDFRETFEEAERIVDGLCPKTAVNTEES